MNDIINEDVIEKVVIKSVAIYKSMSVLPAPPFEDKFVNKKNICQQNEIIQNQNLEKCLNEIEPSKENEITDTTNEIKKNLEKKSWKDITNPKERQKAYNKAYREANKDKRKTYLEANKDKINSKRKTYLEANKDKIKLQKKVYNQANKDKIKLQKKDYREANKDRLKLRKNDYRQANKDKVKLQRKVYWECNKDKFKDKIKAYQKANKDKRNSYIKNKKKTNIQYKLSCNLRNRLNSAVNGNYKSGSAVKDLGCSVEEFKSYLESKFQPGMSWDNWTKDGWHIDHIKPLTSFDLTDRNQLLEACHYTNLQPLWATDNLSKSDKIL
jgi:hypothetical protein